MNIDEIRSLFTELRVDETIEGSRESYFNQALEDLRDEDQLILPHYAFTGPGVSENTAIATAVERLALDTVGDAGDRVAIFDSAFLCRRSVDKEQLNQRDLILHYFYLCADALLADRRAELIMLLQNELDEDVLAIDASIDWLAELQIRIVRAFILLCRKEGGWADVYAAADEIRQLRALQNEKGMPYVNERRGDHSVVGHIIGWFNLAKVVELSASYIINGSPTDTLTQIDRHASNVTEILEVQPDAELLHIADLLTTACQELVRSSIWFSTRRLGARIRQFIDVLTDESRARPVLELWPSQRAALGGNLLDPAKRAIVVEMPTSSGKTLVAEFAVVQALALNPGATVAYVVPTRALVNQITLRLRSDIGQLGFVVEAAVPVFELDPTEDQLLRRNVDILVVTPEKLDLLVRMGHPSVGSLALVVADEAHNIGDGERGARLELLLATLKRERSDTRFLLLTPFVPNGAQLAAWLGDEAESTIQVSWRPSERITAAAVWLKPRNQPYELVLHTLPSVGNVDLNREVEVTLGNAGVSGDRSKGRISVSAAIRLARRGGVLILTRGRADAETRATDVAGLLEDREVSEFGKSVIHYVESELGREHELGRLMTKGVAYHHAGLSHDLRYLIELLIDRGDIEVICGTTTLAQGVNFPIASVIVESLSKPRSIGTGATPLSFAEFWNIAGRAGRALRDRLGLIIFPSRDDNDVQEARSFLQDEAAELASTLVQALKDMTSTAADFNLEFVRFNRELSVFLQYLAHAMRVAGLQVGAAEVEDLLRSSLVYHQARESDRNAADRLVRLARRYIESLQGRSLGYLSLADGTGFSLPSVDFLYARQSGENSEFRDMDFWQPENLFGDRLGPLSSVISVLGQVPELRLGREHVGPFNPDRVAGIIKDWVDGRTVVEIADRWFSDVENVTRRRRDAGQYLYSQLIGQVPWGIGAIQRLAFGENIQSSEAARIPSFIFYGVPSAEAVSLRMVGVPRVAAVGLGNALETVQQEPSTYEDLRSWVGRRGIDDWEAALPADSPLSGDECKSIWATLAGV